jgi:DNA gyrase/topoisomerase IV subunit B
LETKRGIAYTKAEDIFTRMYACSNEKKHLAVGEEFCQIGVMTINAVAERCELMTIHNGKKGTFVFKGGKTESREIESIQAIDTTKITVKLNHKILNNLTFTVEGIRKKAKELSQKLEGFNVEIEAT